MLIVKRKMNIVKQLDKKDNARQRPLGVTQLLKNNSLKNILKSDFGVDVHHNPTRVWSRRTQMQKRMAS
jgi:hypothetical protein